jgi:hypothetical protein
VPAITLLIASVWELVNGKSSIGSCLEGKKLELVDTYCG